MISCGLNIIGYELFYKLGACLEVFYLFSVNAFSCRQQFSKEQTNEQKEPSLRKRLRKHAGQVFFRKRTKGSPNIYQCVIFKPILLDWYVILSKEACPKWKVTVGDSPMHWRGKWACECIGVAPSSMQIKVCQRHLRLCFYNIMQYFTQRWCQLDICWT